ncbi:hypothetical protein AMIS_79120 [Actinoplanes missouriensis 431]|uniref:Uncharacterized protein n=1 Tax=Actinoplanes missouriensis (strain ATCC 14538 / DSM 43046 / CBS 188.64 / JCM 3121 / NBRC 102363 / NCIMB 12654 / NRRL B-3342 / UNCC 431) TaxID=512565 RepID=I0HJE5_ACTM4|nr:hypothetical protein AMIS_79120 [Actinoplanes missouriensis 431]
MAEILAVAHGNQQPDPTAVDELQQRIFRVRHTPSVSVV